MKFSLKTVTGYYNRLGEDYVEKTLTASQTVINITYKVGFINLFREGVEMKPSEYTATNGTTIILDVAAEAGEVLTVKKSKYTW